MRVPRIVTVDKSDIIREDTIKIGHYTKVNMVDESWKEDEISYDKMIKKIEQIVRNSFEYREYIKFLKEEMDMNQCSFFKNVTREDARIEIHHTPFTLYDITSIVFYYMQVNNFNLTIFDIAEEVMKLHYENMVGLFPLSLTAHELVHNGDIFIPIDHVYGNVSKFVDKYKEYMTEEQKELLQKNIDETNKLNIETYNPSVLERRYTYLEIEGVKFPKKISEEINSDKEEEIFIEDII